MGAAVGWVPADDVPTLPKTLHARDDAPPEEEGTRRGMAAASDDDGGRHGRRQLICLPPTKKPASTRARAIDASARRPRWTPSSVVERPTRRTARGFACATRMRFCVNARARNSPRRMRTPRGGNRHQEMFGEHEDGRRVDRVDLDDRNDRHRDVRRRPDTQSRAVAIHGVRVGRRFESAARRGTPPRVRAKSGHVAVFHITEDARATCVATTRIASDAWITTLTWRRNASANGVDLVVGCSNGAVAARAGGVSDAERAFADATDAPRRDLFTEFTRLCDADGAAVTCASIDGDHVIVGKANGDVDVLRFDARERRERASRLPRTHRRRVLLARTRRRPSRTRHLRRHARHRKALRRSRRARFSRARRRRARERDASRAVDACLALAPSPAGDVVLRCDAYEPTVNLPNLDGMKRAKFWRGVVVAVKHPSP